MKKFWFFSARATINFKAIMFLWNYVYTLVKRHSVRMEISYDFSLPIQESNTCSFLSRNTPRKVFSKKNVILQISQENSSNGVFVILSEQPFYGTLPTYWLNSSSECIRVSNEDIRWRCIIGFIFAINVENIQPSKSVQYNRNNTYAKIFFLRSRFSRTVIISYSSHWKVYVLLRCFHWRNFVSSRRFHNIILTICRE